MESQQPKELPYIDRPDVEEVFADKIQLTHWDGYSIRIELAVTRPHVTGQNQTQGTVYPAARIVLTPMAGLALREQLSSLISMFEKQGMVKRVAPSSGEKQ